jgi:hypothetical protein
LTNPREPFACFGGTLSKTSWSLRDVSSMYGDLAVALFALSVLVAAGRLKRRLHPTKA